MAYSFKTNLSFGFVYIPVTLHLVAKDNKISFRLFDKKTKSKIQYKKISENNSKNEVKNEDIVKGYEYEDGKYVLLEDEDFEKIKTPKDKNISIEGFINLNEINPLYYDKSYYIYPTGAIKAYTLLVKALTETKKAGFGKTVLGFKENLVIVRPQEDYLILSTLFFKDEIKDYPETIEKVSINPSELKLAKLLISEMSQKFNISQYEDNYQKKIEALIDKKIKGKKILLPKKQEPVQLMDLMDALKTSINLAEKQKRSRKTS